MKYVVGLILVIIILTGCPPFEEDIYHVHYHRGNATEGDPPSDSNSYRYGDRIEILDEGSLVNEDYLFLGWRRSFDFYTVYSPGETLTAYWGDINLYPVWDDGEDTPFLFDIEAGEAIITGYEEYYYYSRLEIPNTMQSKPVTTIADNVFFNAYISELQLPIHLRHIGMRAFESNSIKDLTIPDTVESVGIGAFRDNMLTRLHLGSGIITIGPYAFARNDLSFITIPEQITLIDAGVFHENDIVMVNIGADVDIRSDISFGTYGASFRELYNLEKKAGVYIYIDDNLKWEMH